MNRSTGSPRRSVLAFTMVEIVLSLAVIAVAMVAIIGVLPLGMNVQSENRETSIVNADASVWVDTIRSGAQGGDYLLEFLQEARETITRINLSDGSTIDETTTYFVRSDFHSVSNLLSLVSQPKFRLVDVDNNGSFDERVRRDVYLDFRAMNGNMGDLIADDDFAFNYRITPELIPKTPPLVSTNQFAWVMQTNLYDLRLQFQWPLLVGVGGDYRGQTKFSRELTFRTLVSGNQVFYTNQFFPADRSKDLYFVNARGFEREYSTNPGASFPVTPLP